MPSQLGAHIRRLRLAVGLTQQQVADLAGMSVAALRDFEQGRVAVPRTATLRRLAQALRLPVGEAEDLIRYGQPGRFPAEEFWLQVLGPLAVWVDGARVTLGSTRQRLLLGCLALTPNVPVSQERLIEMIWGNRPPSNVVELLRNDAVRLRRRLRPEPGSTMPDLVVDTGSYQLALASNQVDLLLFRSITSEARRSRQAGDPHRACRWFSEAMALWQDDPLADLPGLRQEEAREALTREWQAAVVEYARTAIGFGRHDDVLPLLHRAVRADPLHEVASAQLLLALTAAGQPLLASEVFDELRRRLAEGFGTDPGPQVLKAYEVARGHRNTLTPLPVIVARRRLPSDLAEFTGRHAELQVLHRWLSAAPRLADHTALRLGLITGAAGIGKTRLAVHFAHQLLAAGQSQDLQLYAELGPAEPAGVLGTLLGLLGVDHDQLPPDLTGRSALYRDRLAGQRALVLLDDVTSADQVRPLLPASPNALVLVTSRRPIALDGARVLPLERLSLEDAEAILARVAGPERIADDPAAARRLLGLCDHLPLAVSLAARRLRARPGWRIADLVNRLLDSSDLVGELGAGTDQLRGIFASSYDALGSQERGLLDVLVSLPDAPVTAQMVAARARLPLPATRHRLDRLADDSLLIPLPDDSYRVPVLVRHFLAHAAATDAMRGGCRQPWSR